jgi:hypothetical protein
LDILKNGVREKTINGNQLNFSNPKNDNRAKQIKAILNKYKEVYSNKVFKVEDRRHLEKMLPEEKQKKIGNQKLNLKASFRKSSEKCLELMWFFIIKTNSTLLVTP